MTNDELRKEWMRKLPHVEPTDRELSAFALGVEAGVALATPKSHADRWNIDVDDSDGSLLICKGDHEKHEPCVCERYVPAAQQGQDTIAITPRLQTGQQEYLVPVPVDPAAPGPGRHWWPVSKGHADNVCAAAPQQAEPVEIVPRVWRETLRKLTFMARTSGGTPGPDEGLQTACAEAETLLSKPYNYPPAAPQQAEPVEQIGWSDEFGNLFPMGAWKPAQRTHHDSHKAAWRPVFLHPPAAEVQRLREALEYLIEKCGDSDDAQYSTLGTKFVRDIARRALEGE